MTADQRYDESDYAVSVCLLLAVLAALWFFSPPVPDSGVVDLESNESVIGESYRDEYPPVVDAPEPSRSVVLEIQPIPDPNADRPPAPKYSNPTIVLHSAEHCGPCRKWKDEEMPLWVAKGWDVRVEDYKGERWMPWYTIWDGEKEFEIDGYLTPELYREAGGKE